MAIIKLSNAFNAFKMNEHYLKIYVILIIRLLDQQMRGKSLSRCIATQSA